MRAMPSPTSMTVPTSVICSFCSKSAISRFKTLVISATLIAIGLSPIRWVCFSWLISCRQQLLFHQLQLGPDAGIDQLVLHSQDQPADDPIVHLLADDGVLLQGRAHL